MIRKEGVRIIYTCDAVACGIRRVDQDGVRARWRSYPDVWKDAQAEGWTARKKPTVSDYDHFCPGCSAQPATSNGGSSTTSPVAVK